MRSSCERTERPAADSVEDVPKSKDRPASMKAAAVFACLTGAAVTGCSTLPTAGPTSGQVLEQAVKDDQARFDVVDVDDNVVATLLARRGDSFRTRFQKYSKPPAPKIGIGDTVTVTIWEAAGGRLFGSSSTYG